MRKTAAIPLLAFTLAACGSGGSDDGSSAPLTPAPVGTAPNPPAAPTPPAVPNPSPPGTPTPPSAPTPPPATPAPTPPSPTPPPGAPVPTPPPQERPPPYSWQSQTVYCVSPQGDPNLQNEYATVITWQINPDASLPWLKFDVELPLSGEDPDGNIVSNLDSRHYLENRGGGAYRILSYATDYYAAIDFSAADHISRYEDSNFRGGMVCLDTPR